VSNGKIIIGYDERASARDALALGRELADVSGDRLLLISVFPYDATAMGAELFERFLAEDGERVFAPVRDELGDLIETRAVGKDSAARALHEIAEDEQASMVVVGSTERGAVGRVMPGSVGERLLQGAPCPVAVAPRGFAEREGRSLQRLAVAFDGSRQSWAALAFARELAARTRASVDLVGVLSPWGTNAPLAFRFAELGEIADLDEVDETRKEELRRRLGDGMQELPGEVRGREVLLTGNPADELSRWAADEQNNLLVVGSRGYGPVKRVLLGGVSSKLARNAPAPLLVVSRAER
jgi:nucleotide-binding universal stress UspA family protein